LKEQTLQMPVNDFSESVGSALGSRRQLEPKYVDMSTPGAPY